MIEEPWVIPRPRTDDTDDARLPGHEDGPVNAPRVPVRDEGDYRGIDTPDDPDGEGDLDGMAPDAGHR